jgi:hypothetical protein
LTEIVLLARQDFSHSFLKDQQQTELHPRGMQVLLCQASSNYIAFFQWMIKNSKGINHLASFPSSGAKRRFQQRYNELENLPSKISRSSCGKINLKL